jgi:hypothetical protein
MDSTARAPLTFDAETAAPEFGACPTLGELLPSLRSIGTRLKMYPRQYVHPHLFWLGAHTNITSRCMRNKRRQR